jgi:hypothetical protein
MAAARVPDWSEQSPTTLKCWQDQIAEELDRYGGKWGDVPEYYFQTVMVEYVDKDDDDPDSALNLTKQLERIHWNSFECADEQEVLGLRTLPASEVATLLSKGTPSGYGDAKTATTVVDGHVRRAVEHNNKHALVDEACAAADDAIARLGSNVFGVEVEAHPLKVNVYGPGGHFDEHVDTPVPNPMYLGSAVVEFPVEGGRVGGDLMFKQNDHWETLDTNVVVFAPHVHHKVTWVSKGARVTVSFEVFRKHAKDTPPVFDGRVGSGILFEVARAVREHLDAGVTGRVGLVCSNRYSRYQQLYGKDSDLRKELEAFGLRVSEHAVTIKYSSYDDDVSVTVHSREKNWEGCDNTPFYPMDFKGLCEVYSHHVEGAEHTGNESRPDVRDMRYYARALLVSI